MFKRFSLYFVLLLLLVSALAIPAFAATGVATGADYDGAVYYYQLTDGRRIMSENMMKFGQYPIYIISESDGFRFACDKSMYIVYPDDTYDVLSGGNRESYYTSNGKEWYNTRKYTYPANFYGNTITSFSGLQYLGGVSGKGVYRLYADDDYTEGTDFFRNPLLEEVKTQTQRTVEVQSTLVSFLHYLIPFGVGCLALLISVPAFLKLFRIFLR